VFRYLNIQDVIALGATSSRNLTDSKDYIKIEISKLRKAEDFIKELITKLDPEKHADEKIKLSHILNDTIINIPLGIEDTLSNNDKFPNLQGLTIVNLSTIKQSIFDALKSLDNPTIESLKSTSVPKSLEKIFEVLELYNEIKNNPNQGSAYLDLIRAGKLDIAFEVIKFTLNESDRNYAFQTFINNLSKAKEWDKALEIANRVISDPWDIFMSIKSDLIKEKEWDKALEIANRIFDEGSKNTALSNIAIALSEAEKLDQALNVAHLITDERRRNRNLSSFTRGLIKAKKWDKAFEVANLITDKYVRNRILSKIPQEI
ncbi:MAG: hypothetical protein PVI40_07405, partial [Chlamydiota bacterium]